MSSQTAKAKSTILTVALAAVGVFEFFERVGEGDSKLTAAQKAVKRTQLRTKAIQKAAKALAPQIRRAEQEEEES